LLGRGKGGGREEREEREEREKDVRVHLRQPVAFLGKGVSFRQERDGGHERASETERDTSFSGSGRGGGNIWGRC
jgi:hypothetical protein